MVGLSTGPERVFIHAALAITLVTAPVAAQTPLGDGFPISTASEDQWNPSIATNAETGESLVAWHDRRNYRHQESGHDVYGQLVSRDGELVGSEFPISSLCTLNGIVFNDTRSEYLVVYSTFHPCQRIYARRFGPDGEALGDEALLVSAPGCIGSVALSFDSARDRYLLAWSTPQSPLSAQFFDYEGTPVADSFSLASHGSHPSIAYDKRSGRFLISWELDTDVMARVLYPDGVMSRPVSFGPTLDDQGLPSATFNPWTGQYLVVFYSQDAPKENRRLYGQLIDADGALADADFLVSEDVAAGRSVPVHLPASNDFALAWLSDGNPAAEGICTQLFGERGLPNSSVYGLKSSATCVQYLAVGLHRRTSRMLLVWEDDRNGASTGETDIYGQIVDVPSGAAFMNGSSLNPALYEASTPVIGTEWLSLVHNANHPDALFSQVWVSGEPTSGVFTGAGELLLSRTKPMLLVSTLPSTGPADLHSVLLPNDLALHGMTLASQAVILGDAGAELCNGYELTLRLPPPGSSDAPEGGIRSVGPMVDRESRGEGDSELPRPYRGPLTVGQLGARAAGATVTRAGARSEIQKAAIRKGGLGTTTGTGLAGEASYSATWILHLLPPVEAEGDTFDATLLHFLEITVLRIDEDGSEEILEVIDASGNRISIHEDFYKFGWRPTGALLRKKVIFRYSVAGLPIGSFTHVPTSRGMMPVRFEIDAHPVIRARVMKEQGFSASDVAGILIDEFALGSPETVHLLANESYGPAAIGGVLLDFFGASAQDAASVLRSVGIGAEEIATVLRDAYFAHGQNAAEILRDIGFGCIDIAQAVRVVYSDDPTPSSTILAAIGCGTEEDCEAPDDLTGTEDVTFTRNIVEFSSTVLRLLQPLGNPGDMLDRSLLGALRLSLSEVGPDGSRTLHSQFTAGGGGGPTNGITLKNGFYQFNWKPDPADAGKQFELRFSVAGLDIGFIEYTLVTPRTLPIKFRLDRHPVIRARVLHEGGSTATAIVTALLGEFPLQAHEVAKVLFEEGFTAAELGVALRDGLSSDASEAADSMRRAGIGATLTIQSLDGAFGMGTTQSVPVLRAVGYGALEVWRALEVVYELEDDVIEDLLGTSGYSEEEVLEALAPRLLFRYACLIERSGPLVYFERREPFFPSSIDWFMEVSPLVGDVDGDGIADITLSPGAVNPTTLVDTVDGLRALNNGEGDFWFDVPNTPAARAGDLASTKMYVHAVRLRDLGKTDLQFWLFYPYNGPGSMAVRSGIFGSGDVCSDFDNPGNVAPLGEHESDWEVLVLRFDDTTNDLEEVYMSAHGDYIRYPADELTTVDGHVVAYSALNGHAFFPRAGENPHREKYVDFGLGDFELKTLNLTMAGPSFSSWTNYEFIAVDGTSLNAPWLEFDGVWGATEEFGLSYLDKVGIVYGVAENCLLEVKFIHIPVYAATAALALCGVGCGIGCIWSTFFYWACFGACMGICVPAGTAGLIATAELAIDPLIWGLAPEIVDSAFPNQLGTGKPGPASRGQEWRHFRIPNERPRIIDLTIGDPVAGTREVIVSIPNEVFERKGDKWLLGPKARAATPTPSRVELGIDGVYTDITASEVVTALDRRYTFEWTPATTGPDTTYLLSPRYFDADGLAFEYPSGRTFDTAPGAPEIGVSLELLAPVIGEGESATVTGTFDPGTGGGSMLPYEVSIDWGDGVVDEFSTQDAVVSADHSYLDDGPYSIHLSVLSGVLTGSAITQIVVGNLPPLIDSTSQAPPSSSLHIGGVTVQASAAFTDAGALDEHSVRWDWGDGTEETQEPVTSPVEASHTYSSPGVHRPVAEISDDDRYVGRATFDPVVVGQAGSFSGVGSILAPVSKQRIGTASFEFDLSKDVQRSPVVTLDFTIEQLAISGIGAPSVTFSGDRVDVEGHVTINGEATAANGEPYQARIVAVDGLIDDTFEIRVWSLDDDGAQQIFYETEAGQILTSGDLSVDEMEGTANGTGTIDAPFVTSELGMAMFRFVQFMDTQGNWLADLDFEVEGPVVRGVESPSITIKRNSVEIEGGVSVNGLVSSPCCGDPYRARIIAVDGPEDRFEIRIWTVDANGGEEVVYETEEGQVLQSGTIEGPAPMPWAEDAGAPGVQGVGLR